MPAATGIEQNVILGGGGGGGVVVVGAHGDGGRRGTEGSVCTLLDGRTQGCSIRPQLCRLWVKAMRDLLDLEYENIPSLSIVTLHEGYYEFRLPIDSHSIEQLQQALNGIEQDCVLSAWGLQSSQHSESHLAAGGRAAPSKRQRKSWEPKRFYAVGEDCALAALRSALSQLAEIGPLATNHRLLFFCPEPERLLPFAGEVQAHLLPGMQLDILMVHPIGDAEFSRHQVARARCLQTQLLGPCLGLAVPKLQSVSDTSNGSGSGRTAKLRVVALPLCSASIFSQVRSLLDVKVPFMLHMPRLAQPQDLLLLGSTVITIPNRIRSLLLTHATIVRGLSVVERVPSSSVSVELLFGLPLIMRPQAEQLSPWSIAFECLVRKLSERHEGLLLTGHVSPNTWAPTTVNNCFLALPQSLPGGGRAALVLQGIASQAIWQPFSSLRHTDKAKGRLSDEVEEMDEEEGGEEEEEEEKEGGSPDSNYNDDDDDDDDAAQVPVPRAKPGEWQCGSGRCHWSFLPWEQGCSEVNISHYQHLTAPHQPKATVAPLTSVSLAQQARIFAMVPPSPSPVSATQQEVCPASMSTPATSIVGGGGGGGGSGASGRSASAHQRQHVTAFSSSLPFHPSGMHSTSTLPLPGTPSQIATHPNASFITNSNNNNNNNNTRTTTTTKLVDNEDALPTPSMPPAPFTPLQLQHH
mmetsp:Transcript_86254/g.180478  ORF Transcript_86254/g.180478 Transcript_86254/m.180478 type:complete len:692 (-) Transcript_86254:109-2184(-)